MMLMIENMRMAFSSLRANKSRSLLTMLGIIIGIASVITIMTIGNSMQSYMASEMQSMGATNITIQVKNKIVDAKTDDYGYASAKIEHTGDISDDFKITDEMIASLERQFSDEIQAVSLSTQIDKDVIAKYRGNDRSALIYGINQGYFIGNSFTYLAGGEFTTIDYVEARPVVIIDDKFVENAMDDIEPKDALGKTVEIKIGARNLEATVIGVTESGNDFISLFMGNKSTFYMPIKSVNALNHEKNYESITVITKPDVDVNACTNKFKDYMQGFYRKSKSCVIDANNMSAMVDSMNSMMSTMVLAISLIAGIALLVGGIGVMNIMLVSITERTREIGTRKALGATNKSIKTQFIIEAMTLCLVGGMIGVILGVFAGSLGAKLIGYTASPSISSIFISLFFSLAIGVFFGYYPANKAAKMNPIDALRYE